LTLWRPGAGPSAHLHHLHLAHDGVAARGWDSQKIPSATVNSGCTGFSAFVLADQKRRRFARGEVEAQALDEVLELHLAVVEGLPDHATKRVHEHELRVRRLDLLDDDVQGPLRDRFEHLRSQVQEANTGRNLGGIEERELLLIAQHLDRRFPQDRDVQRVTLGARAREHDLVGQRRLTAPRAAGDQVEGELGKPAAQHLVEARDPAR
jgi:hypothetical protein